MKTLSYKHTIAACNIGYIVQSVVCNFAPLLFVTFSKEYNISIAQITSIITINFAIQIVTDLLSVKYVDKIGYKKSMIIAHILSAIGFVSLGVLPQLISPYPAIFISILIYSVGSGLLEVLVSPIVEACPTDNKKGTMALLHSFYCWGTAAVIIISTIFFSIFGRDNWKILAVLWALLPLFNAVYVVFVPINNIVEEHEKVPIKQLSKSSIFYVVIGLMMTAGASELAMSQWASTFAETGLNVSKTVGDLAGPCLFAILMGSSRVLYSFISEKVNLRRYMTLCGFLAILSYLIASLSGNPVVSLLGCSLCGFAVGVLWPGTMSIAAKNVKEGGTAMFAILALAGDVGCTIGPSTIGFISDKMGGIKSGLGVGVIFPILLVICLLLLKKSTHKKA